VIIGGASNATIVTADIQICGAVMHIIDAVLLPTAIYFPLQPSTQV